MTLMTVVLAWTAATAGVALHAFGQSRPSRRRPRRRSASRTAAPSVLLLRACAGGEPGLAAALASSAHASDVARIRFLVAATDDPARPVAEAAAQAIASCDADVVVTGARAANAKAEQLARGAQGAMEDVIVVCDSDVVVTRALVDELVDAVAGDGDDDAAWAPPVERTPRTRADRASAAVLDASLHAFALLSALDTAGMVGKAFAIRRDALEAIGGFSVLTDRLGEDMELARRLAAAGRRVRAISTPAASVACNRTWHHAIARYARWLLVIRAQRPALLLSYPLLLAAAPLQAALAIAAWARDGLSAVPAITAVVFARAAVAAFARTRSGAGLRDAALAPWAADALLLAALARALTTRTFRWRGRALRIARGGRLVEAEP